MVDRKSAEKQFRILFEAAPNGVMAVNVSGHITMLNAQAAKIFGYFRQELVGQSVAVLVPERFRQRHDRLRKSFAANPHMRLMGTGRDLFGVRKDGGEFPMEVGLNHIATSMGDVIIATVVDITGRKRVEKQDNLLEQARAKVKLCEDLGLPAAILRSDGRVLFLNSLLEKFQPQVVFKADRIELSNMAANKLFMEAVASLESIKKNRIVENILIPAEGDRRALIFRLMRVDATNDLPGATLGLLIVRRVSPPKTLSVDLLKSVFTLTSAEARVAALIGSGNSLNQTAGRLHISMETARTQLHHVYAKIGVSRQSELTALLATFFLM